MELVTLRTTQARTLDMLAQDYANVEENIKNLEKMRAMLKAEILDIIPADEKAITPNGFEVKHITRKLTSFDETGIKASVSQDTWLAIRKEVVDKDKVKASPAIQATLAPYTTVTTSHSITVDGGR